MKKHGKFMPTIISKLNDKFPKTILRQLMNDRNYVTENFKN